MKIALVTSSINVLVSDSTFREPISREAQTYEAINKFVDYFDIVYLVDGSNHNFGLIGNYISKENLLKIKTHTFLQDVENLDRHGKALGEILIYEEFLKATSSEALEDYSIVKISGRWFINNFKKIEGIINDNNNLFIQYYPKTFEFRKYIQTCFYKIEYSRLEKLVKYGSEYYLTNKNNAPLEVMLYNFLLNENKIFINMEYPDYSGVISGSTGQEIKKDDYYKIQNLLSKYLKQYCFRLE